MQQQRLNVCKNRIEQAPTVMYHEMTFQRGSHGEHFVALLALKLAAPCVRRHMGVQAELLATGVVALRALVGQFGFVSCQGEMSHPY